MVWVLGRRMGGPGMGAAGGGGCGAATVAGGFGRGACMVGGPVIAGGGGLGGGGGRAGALASGGAGGAAAGTYTRGALLRGVHVSTVDDHKYVLLWIVFWSKRRESCSAFTGPFCELSLPM